MTKRARLLALTLPLAFGCTRAASQDPPGQAHGEITMAPQKPVDPCVAPHLQTGPRTFVTGGIERSFTVDAPPPNPGVPKPLLLAFHGWGGDPDQLERTTGLTAAATARGWVIARVLGVGKSWNAGSCCGDAVDLAIDDVKMARELVATIAAEACIDKRRIHATGFSNGGFLAHRLGCEASDLFASIASVGGTLGIPTCAPQRGVSVLHVHGEADGIVKFEGTEAKGWSSVATVIDTWLAADGCTRGEVNETYAQGNAQCVRYMTCPSPLEVTLCRDLKLGHTWPGPSSTGYGGSKDLDATSMVLSFFERNPMLP